MATPVSEETLGKLSSISADDLHSRLVRAHRLGNRLRREFLEALLALEEGWLYVKLGFSSVSQYAERYFGYQHSETYEMLRVAKALRHLPRSARAFDTGEICWSALKEISRLVHPGASEDSESGSTGGENAPLDEDPWLDLAKTYSVRRLAAEVKEAIRKNRRTPRRKGNGMPRVAARVVLEFTPEDHDVVVKAFRKVAAEVNESLGGKHIGPEQALLFMSRRWLETDEASLPRGRLERQESAFTVLYHLSEGCQRATLPTSDGQVEIPRETVERVEAVAHKVTIDPEEERPKSESSTHSNGNGTDSPRSKEQAPRDPPNSSTLSRKVVLRDGQVCANPHCRRRVGLHAHHIHFRSRGGATELWNEVAVCSTCHSLIHLGYLVVEGDPLTGLSWRARADSLGAFDLEEDLRFIASLGVHARSEPSPGEAAQGSSEGGVRHTDSGRPENLRNIPRPETPSSLAESRSLLKALRQLGFSKNEALERLREAEARLRVELERQPTEEELLLGAVKQ